MTPEEIQAAEYAHQRALASDELKHWDVCGHFVPRLAKALRERDADVLALTEELEAVRSATTREQKEHLEEIARLERLVSQRDEEAAEMLEIPPLACVRVVARVRSAESADFDASGLQQ